MTFLPVVGRELQVAARRKFAYWGRFTAAALAMVVFGLIMLLAWESQGREFKTGDQQFLVMRWFCFLFACPMGVFLTADCVSEEKQEGTLGLLFLTDLRGYDIILGKFVSQSAQTLYALLATFPVIALTLIIGGVTGAEFWRVILMICNTAFFTLSLGMFASTFSRDTVRAMNWTILLSLIFLVGLPLAEYWHVNWNSTLFKPRFSHASPGYLFGSTSFGIMKDYWFELGLQHALAWGFLIVSSLWVPHVWRDKAAAAKQSKTTLASRWQYGGPAARLARRRRLLAKTPIQWLATRERSPHRLVWIVFLLGMGLMGFGWWVQQFWFNRPVFVVFLLTQCLYFWITAQVCRFFIEARRCGALELLLVTPVEPRQIIRGQWLALARNFLVPVLLLAGVKVVGELITAQGYARQLSGVTNHPYRPDQIVAMLFERTLEMAVSVAGLWLNLAAVAWFAMWAGLTSRKLAGAILKSLCFVLLLPFLGIGFLRFLVPMLLMNRPPYWGVVSWLGWWTPFFLALPYLVKNLIFIWWSRRRVLTRFREIASQLDHQSATPRRGIPPHLPPLPASSVPGATGQPP